MQDGPPGPRHFILYPSSFILRCARMLQHLLDYFRCDLAVDLGTANTLIGVAGEGLVLDEPSVVAVEQGTRPDPLRRLRRRAPRPANGRPHARADRRRPPAGRRRDHRLRALRGDAPLFPPQGAAARLAAEAAGAGGRARLHHAGGEAGRLQQRPAGRRRQVWIMPRGQGRRHRRGPAHRRAAGQHGLRRRRRHHRSGRDEPGRHGRRRNRSAPAATAWTGRSSITSAATTACASACPPPNACGSTSAAPTRWKRSWSPRSAALDTVSGLPRKATITSEEVRQALDDPLEAILEAVKTTLDHCSPDLAADLVDHGMVLCGGGALLRRLDRFLGRADRPARPPRPRAAGAPSPRAC